MFKTAEFPVVLAKLGLNCPEHDTASVNTPPGEAPVMLDMIALHIPLHTGSLVRRETEDRYDPGMSRAEAYLDQSDDDKPGTLEHIITRKGWGKQTVKLFGLPENERRKKEPELGGKAHHPLLQMSEASLKGKPRVLFKKDVPPVLRVELCGTLVTGQNGESHDPTKRKYVHSLMYCQLHQSQTELPLDGENLEEFDGAVSDGEEPWDVSLSEEVPEQESPEQEEEDLSGNRQVGNREEALPEHSFTAKTVRQACEAMEELSPGFSWRAIQRFKADGKAAADGKIRLGWGDIEAAANAAGMITEFRAVKKRLAG